MKFITYIYYSPVCTDGRCKYYLLTHTFTSGLVVLIQLESLFAVWHNSSSSVWSKDCWVIFLFWQPCKSKDRQAHCIFVTLVEPFSLPDGHFRLLKVFPTSWSLCRSRLSSWSDLNQIFFQVCIDTQIHSSFLIFESDSSHFRVWS